MMCARLYVRHSDVLAKRASKDARPNAAGAVHPLRRSFAAPQDDSVSAEGASWT
ncbi:hypothetical protein ACVIYL_004797 [Bradyrhizobium sp. USDA 3315]